jgi:hypothetical protein
MIGLTIFGYCATSSYQDRIQELEIKNRAILNGPSLEFNLPPKADKTVMVRDTNWIVPKFDYEKGKDDERVEISFITKSDFTFFIINNSNTRADILWAVLLDTLSATPKPFKEMMQMPKKGSNVDEAPLQLGSLDTMILNIKQYQISFIDEKNTFYLHLIIYYTNQFDDIYESYFVIKGLMRDNGKMAIIYKTPPLLQKLTIKDIYLSNYISLEPNKPIINYLGSEKETDQGLTYNDIIDKYLKEKNKGLQILNK